MFAIRIVRTHLAYLHKGRAQICQDLSEPLSLHVRSPLVVLPEASYTVGRLQRSLSWRVLIWFRMGMQEGLQKPSEDHAWTHLKVID